MEISDTGENVRFKSLPTFFVKERNGTKPNTQRIFTTRDEEMAFVNNMFGLLTITIENTETKEEFTRVISDISYSGVFGIRLYIISWVHREGASEP